MLNCKMGIERTSENKANNSAIVETKKKNSSPLGRWGGAFLKLSGLEPLIITPESNFIKVGGRTTVAGSKKFLRLIKEDKFEDGLAVAREEVAGGAQTIDVKMHA